MSEPTVDELLEVLARAAVGDAGARVALDADAAQHPLGELGLAINLLLGDLTGQAGGIEAAERVAAGAARAQLLGLLRRGLQAPRAALAEIERPDADARALRLARDRLAALATTLDELDELVGVERGVLLAAEEPVDVCALVREGAGRVSLPATTRLEVELDDAIPAELRGDGDRLRQLLDVLLATAASTTPEGLIRIRVAADPAGAWWVLRLSVSDDGEGVPPPVLRRAVDPYDGPPLAEAGLEHVLGLRLALASRTAEAAGGRLELQSVPGRGTSALAVIPLAGPAAADDPLGALGS